MNSKRAFYAMLAGVVILVLAVLGSAYVANGMLGKQAKILHDLKLTSQVLDGEQTGLIKAKKDIAKYNSLNRIAKTIVPQDKDQAQTVREIVKLANESGIQPTSISFPASTLGSAATAKGVTTPGAPAAAAGLTQLTPVKGLTSVYIQQITVTQDSTAPVAYSKFIDFLSRLEQNRRTAQVSSIALQPVANNAGTLSFTLTLDEYIKP